MNLTAPTNTMPDLTEIKRQHITQQLDALELEVWKFDSNAKALAKAGMKDQAEENAKKSAECSRLIEAFREQLDELTPQKP